MSRIITIDGPAGVGKSTLARLTAKKLNIPYLDTGAMFRCVAYQLGERALNLSREELLEACKNFSFKIAGSGDGTTLFNNNEPIGSEIRNENIAARASTISQKQEIRDFLLQAQREIGEQSDLVAEGRDMGTVVFPNASYKFFLDAAPIVRATRRLNDLKMLGKPVPDLNEITKIIQKRDEQDRNRKLAPLKPALDATIIETDELSVNEVLQKILDTVQGLQTK